MPVKRQEVPFRKSSSHAKNEVSANALHGIPAMPGRAACQYQYVNTMGFLLA
jgi:hypothetical protein